MSHAPSVARAAGSAVEAAPNDTYAFVGAFFAELSASGVRHVCVSPGSRSTPLAVAAFRQPGLSCWVHVDERSAGFFALGLARALREPVALVCTSGTAAANYLPAVVEAAHARQSLVVLTADRPPELRDWDAGQTIDQLKLFGSQVRWFAELPLPGATTDLLRYARSLASRAVAESRGQRAAPGPVHLNWPLREPLEPTVAPRTTVADPQARAGRGAAAWTQASSGAARPTPRVVSALCDLALAHVRGVIACGPLDADAETAAALLSLAGATGWPILADPASGLRAGAGAPKTATIVANGELLLRCDGFAERYAPDLVLRFGSTPVSKAFRLWLERRPPRELVVVDGEGGWSDPSHLASRVLAADPRALCEEVVATLAPGADGTGGSCGEDRPAEGRGTARRAWCEAWRAADARAGAAVARSLAGDDRLLEPRLVRELVEALPGGALLTVSNSMPIRHLDAVMPISCERVRVLANRGANGIDGVTSSALGAAAAGVGPAVLLTGDLAFLHDLGGLLAARRHGLQLVIVVLDNDGGGIFSFLPIAAHGDSVGFEPLFRTPHGLDLAHAARLFQLAYHRVGSFEHYRAALKEAAQYPGTTLVHVRVDRDASVEAFRAMAAAVAAVAVAEPERERP